MRRWWTEPAVVGALLLVGCAGAPVKRPRPLTSAELEQGLRAADQAFATATLERGAEGWASFFAEDGEMLVNGGGVVRGPEAIRARMARVFAIPGFQLRFSAERAEVSGAGELGYTFGLYEASVPDGPPPSRGKYVTIWRKDTQGRWRVVLEVGSEGQLMPAELEKGKPEPQKGPAESEKDKPEAK